MPQRLRMVVSVACALGAVCVCALYGAQTRKEAQKVQEEAYARYGGEVVTLAVCNRALEAGEVISAADVSEREWLSSLAPDDAILSLDDVLGRELSVPAAAGAPLTELNFRDRALQAEIPSGHVAVAVPITDKLGVSQGVAEGTHVVAYRAAEGEAELIGGNAIVLSAPAAGASLAGRMALTVAVDSKDVPAILAASTSGDLRLVVPAEDVRTFAKGRAALDEVEPESGVDDQATDVQGHESAEAAGDAHADGQESRKGE